MSFRHFLTSLSIIIFLPLLSFAGANELNGRVLDSKGAPLYGVVVELPDLKSGAVTDTGGRYYIKNLPKGSYLVQAHLLSYTTATKTVDINGSTTANFILGENVIEKNEVVVTGISRAGEEKRSITPIQSIGIKEIHENASSNIIDAITSIPGVNQVTTGPAVSKPVIRGLSYNRIVTLNDGVRQEGQQWGDEHGIEIDDYNVSRVEVLKGPASLMYGSDAIAGVINIISNDAVPTGKIMGDITTNYQTNNGLAALYARLGGNNNGIYWSVYGTAKAAHDYSEPKDGTVYDTRFNNMDYGAKVGINKSWGSSELAYTSFDQHLGIAEGERDSLTGAFVKHYNDNGFDATKFTTVADKTSYKMDIPNQHINHQKLAWNNNLYMNNGGRMELSLGYQQNKRQEFGDVLNPDQAGLSLLLQTYTYEARYFMPVWNGWQVTTGVNGMYQQNTNKGSEFLVPNYSLFDMGGYGIAKKDMGAWSVAGGLRYDFRTINTHDLYVMPPITNGFAYRPAAGYQGDLLFSAFSKNYSNVSGSLGTSYAVGKSTILKLNVASGYRAPNIAELSANGVHDGTYRYEEGNTSLKSENSVQADLGLSWSSEHVMVTAAVFDNYIKNFIFIRKLQSVNGGDSIPSTFNDNKYSAYLYSQSDANLYGGELYIDYHPHPFDWLHLENTFSYVRGMFVSPTSDSTRNLPLMPPFRWLINLRAQKRDVSNFIKNAYVKVGLDINGNQNNVFTAYSTETPTPGYTLLDAGIGFDLVDRAHNTVCTFTVAAQNLTNVAYQNPLSRLKYGPENYLTGNYGIYNMGRNISFTASFPLLVK
jgi:iron complex outermembrane receptor protein